ncbi:LicD family protein [Eubacterium oxidoreducens]|uniref:Lipopolysaccharide cholinephosphotransferase n=1 Tax=Eubacterium oxidoreducens TaxID=1732 RepID=A0A1G6B4L9_EUBOX|nr:LicD family protein [Eubacterium oxidoreducens]SDB15620.1 lipopolysaccharide cholinephosphotransferase [Eubacterium oxidoreducens]
MNTFDRINREEFLKPEYRDDWYVDERMKAIWYSQLEMICEVNKICEKHQIKWFIAHGTLLGAVRHGGFIPWDDDIDINMPREDYERFRKIANEELKAPFFFQCSENESDYFLGFGRIRDERGTDCFLADCNKAINNGIYMDIFPMDDVIEDEKKRYKQSKKIEKYRRLNYASIYAKTNRAFYEVRPLQWWWYCIRARFLQKLYGKQYLIEQFNRACQLGNHKGGIRSAIHCLRTNYECCYWYKEDYEKLTKLSFEGLMMPAPAGYKRCLEIKWKDYMALPPVHERGYKHVEHIIDPFVSYKEFPFERFTDFPKYNRERELILYAAGTACEDFLKRYGKNYPIRYIVDGNPDKVGTIFHGCRVISFEQLKEDIKQAKNCQILITSMYYQEIGQQLDNIGLTEHYVFIRDRRYECN